MNIVLLGSHNRLREDFSETDHTILTTGIRKDSDVRLDPGIIPMPAVLSKIRGRMQPDLILLIDDSLPLFFPGIEDIDVPTAWYAVDTHLHVSWHRSCAKLFDFVFVAQKDFIDLFQEEPTGNHIQWLPLYCNTRRDKKIDMPKIHDVSFVGSLNRQRNPERVRLMEYIAGHVPLHTATGDYVEVFNRSKIVLNQSVNGDVNFRTFEALGCGSFLLTEKVENGQSELFSDGVHCALYDKNNDEQIVERIHYFLQHDAEREAIARQGMHEVLEHHTSRQRVAAMCNLFTHCDSRAVLQHRKSNLSSIKRHAARLYGTLSCPELSFPENIQNSFYDTALGSINNALGGHLSLHNMREFLNDAVVFSDLLINRSRYDEAENFLKKAAALGGKARAGDSKSLLSLLYCRLGIVYCEKKDLASAQKAFQKSLRLAPDNAAAARWLDNTTPKV